MQTITFSDKMVSYDTFLNDLASRVARIISQNAAGPEFVSQRKAYQMFGRANVDRWRKKGKVHIYVRPGKIEYQTAELRQAQLTAQDYY